MRHRFLAIVSVLTTLVATSSASPSVFETFLDGASESPPNASPGTGYTRVTIDSTAHTMRVEAVFQGLLGPTTASHIHVINGPGDVNLADTLGPVATTTPTFLGFPSGVTSGLYDQTFDMTLASSYRAGWIADSGGTTALAEAQLFAGIMSGRAYLNIHSSNFAGGEIRGFLQPVPEPATMAALGMGALVLLRRRKK